ncbi:MAG: hypothetical protein ACT4NX_04280 [Deltaproteobacteria bacterium]
MNERIIRTNDRCEECGDFLAFEVLDSNTSKNGYKILYGVWTCATCGSDTCGLWTGAERSAKHGDESAGGMKELCELVEKGFGAQRYPLAIDSPRDAHRQRRR